MPTGKVCGEVMGSPPMSYCRVTEALSAAVAAKVTEALQAPGSALCVMGEAGQTIVGFSESLIVTVKLHSAVLPAASLARAWTVVVPTGNWCGELMGVPATSYATLAEQLSVAVAAKLTQASARPGSVICVIGAGQTMVGFSVSLTVTVTVKLEVLVLPLLSVTV